MANVCVLNLEYSFLSVLAHGAEFASDYGHWRHVDDVRFIDNLPLLCKAAHSLSESGHGSVVVAEPQLDHPLITVAINGGDDYVREARAAVLREYNQVALKAVLLLRDEFRRIDDTFHQSLERVCQHHQLEATIVEVDDDYVLTLYGYQDAVTAGDTAVRILVDCNINQYLCEAIDIDLSLVPLVGGVDLFNFSQVAAQANANIYVPDLLPNVFGTSLTEFKLWVTAPGAAEVTLAKEMLNRLISQRMGSGLRLLRKEIDMLRLRLDLLSLYSQLALFTIMFKYGVYIKMPPLGGDCRVVVQGYSMHAVNDAVSDINLLATEYYQTRISYFAPVDEFMLLQLMRARKTLVVLANQYGMDIEGLASEIKLLMIDMAALAMPDFTHVRLRLELASTQREFISGKKNGKLIKILNQLNQLPTIKFRPYNGHNFYLDFEIVEGTNLLVLTKGLDLLELELPAELKFNVPEVFHKSIIGNGGTIIQLIMKKHNVFIKFSSTGGDDYARDIYLFKRAANVLIKCPRKNAGNIDLVRAEIEALVNHCLTTASYHTEHLKLLRPHYLLMINTNKMRAIHDLEAQFGTFIDFPALVEAFDDVDEVVVAIKGTELKTKQCLRQLHQLMPKNWEFCIPASPRLFADHFAGASGEFFSRIVVPFRIHLAVEVVVNHTPLYGDLDDHQIILSYYDDYAVQTAINDLTQYLREKKFSILEKKPFVYDAKRQRRPAPVQDPLPPLPPSLRPTDTSLLKPSQVASQMFLPFGPTMPVRQPIW